MFRIGEKQTLVVEKMVPMGVYLKEKTPETEEKEESEGKDAEHVLLPRTQVPEGAAAGDEVTVFLYKDSEDRLIATRKEPKLTLHEVGYLTVKEVGRIGAFLDWGLDKDLLLPFHEQPRDQRVQKGQSILCAVYLDKSGRLAATMNVYPWLSQDSPYHKGDEVTGTVYETSENFGRFVAVDDRYSALIPKREAYGGHLQVGDKVHARVIKVREDGKLDLSVREKAFIQMDADAEKILEILDSYAGVLPFSEKASPEVIKRETGLSKNAFKRAIGHLYKERLIDLTGGKIRKIQ